MSILMPRQPRYRIGAEHGGSPEPCETPNLGSNGSLVVNIATSGMTVRVPLRGVLRDSVASGASTPSFPNAPRPQGASWDRRPVLLTDTSRSDWFPCGCPLLS
jgi:hypothetical protein